MTRLRIVNGTIEDLHALGVPRTERGTFSKGGHFHHRQPLIPVPTPESLPSYSDIRNADLSFREYFSIIPPSSRGLQEARKAQEQVWASKAGPVVHGTVQQWIESRKDRSGARPGTGTAWLCRCNVFRHPGDDTSPVYCNDHGIRYSDCFCGGIDALSGYSSCRGHHVTLGSHGWVTNRSLPQESNQPIDRKPYIPRDEDCRTWVSTPGR